MSAQTDPLAAFMGRQTSPSRALLKSRGNVVRTFLHDVPDFLAATDDDVEAWLDGKRLPRRRYARTEVTSGCSTHGLGKPA